MRQKRESQLRLTSPPLDHIHAEELEEISRLLDEHPELPDLIWQDLMEDPSKPPDRGASGMSAEQVLRAWVVKQINEFTYRELEFHLKDSSTYRRFCRLGFQEGPGPSRSALQANIKRIKDSTLEKINRILVKTAQEEGIESGETVRIDCTAVEANIHKPADSEQLWDGVHKLTELMHRARRWLGPELIEFSDRTLRANRRRVAIQYARRARQRKKGYQDLLRVSREVCTMAHVMRGVMREVLASFKDGEMKPQRKIFDQLGYFVDQTEKVIDQTHRRVVAGEQVPSSEKVLSIYEPHVDTIKKGDKVYYGHKICLTGGTSSMILDCKILEGNPADSDLAVEMVDRQVELYGRAPKEVAFDGGFASKPNLEQIKKKGVKNVVFTKHRGMQISDMVTSSWIYKRLRKFRAGIESCISFLKRVLGLARCPWRSFDSFKSYVWSSMVTCNLLLMARHRLT